MRVRAGSGVEETAIDQFQLRALRKLSMAACHNIAAATHGGDESDRPITMKQGRHRPM